jgi:hypothetical protein
METEEARALSREELELVRRFYHTPLLTSSQVGDLPLAGLPCFITEEAQVAALQTIAGSHVASLRVKSSNLMFRGIRCRVLVPAPCSATTQSSPKSVGVLHFPDLEATAKATGTSVQSWTVDIAHCPQHTAHSTIQCFLCSSRQRLR